mgnify:CR=1 FL=1
MSSRPSSLGLRTTNFTATQACWELIAPSTRRIVVKEISLVQATATACSYGLGRPQAIGVTPVPVLFQRDDPSDAASTSAASLSWGTSPTVPLIFMRRWNSSAAVGPTMIWQFPEGLVVAASATLVLWNISTGVAMDINCKIEE